MHGRRLDALWKLSNNTALNEEDMTRALLTIAAAALRPGHAFAAHLLRVDAEVLFVEETISRGPHAALLPNTGTRVDRAESLFRTIAKNGGIDACPDVLADPERSALRVGRETGTRSFLACGFRAENITYVVALVSEAPVAEPFGPDDTHFIESLAGLLESRLTRRNQRARLLARALAV